MRTFRTYCNDLAEMVETDQHVQEKIRAAWVLLGALSRETKIPVVDLCQMIEKAERSLR